LFMRIAIRFAFVVAQACVFAGKGKCCNEQCQSKDECASNLFYCPYHHVCMDDTTKSTIGPACDSCQHGAAKGPFVKCDNTTSAMPAGTTPGSATRLEQPGYSFRLCGNYCGPGWCDAKMIAEGKCDDSSGVEGTSCADKCCKMHDKCCGHSSDQRPCNQKIVECLDKCDRDDKMCTNAAGLGIAAGGIATGMHIVEDWCCGEPCH